MKKALSTSGIVLLIALFFASCEKCDVEDCDLIPAKVLRYDCDRVIFQLLTNEPIGDAEWVDTHTGEKYSNVVSNYNSCAIVDLTRCVRDTLYVKVKKIDEDLTNPNCVQCQAVSSSPPQTRVNFLQASISPCAQSVQE